ncbi:hypothetical protein IU474_16780 [Nocardia otitidiscaviarum]|uniref:hypothetical protein n=1 Tax=Nocardia otitidiscaviarum TaxID=1823 RepID=UPI0018934121|nr:hypothetical protein [Nocardia otitidiscaviarum]MBF6238706.1 hypothetical protein [Nocardia otitidiscaviarum]
MAKNNRKTVSALADFSFLSPGARMFTPCVEQVEIPLAARDSCTHEDTLCPECADQWRADHLFCERLPWERRRPHPH